MVTCKLLLDKGAYEPKKAHDDDAGFDIFLPDQGGKPVIVPWHSSVVIDTGVHLQIPHGYVGFIKSKSGLNVFGGLLGEGVIDAGYTGSIKVKLYNHSDVDYIFNAGDKITQLVILPVPDVEIKRVVALDNTERMFNGFGSTGK